MQDITELFQELIQNIPLFLQRTPYWDYGKFHFILCSYVLFNVNQLTEVEENFRLPICALNKSIAILQIGYHSLQYIKHSVSLPTIHKTLCHSLQYVNHCDSSELK